MGRSGSGNPKLLIYFNGGGIYIYLYLLANYDLNLLDK
ncbi:hypothetical protein IGJ19_001416 [Enterococcus sp. DIV1368b]|nr:hypothetical protein RV08_GL000717 [Enterococcus mundtii]STD24028.1 Uncharacterised protein [Enterococcus mundtii]